MGLHTIVAQRARDLAETGSQSTFFSPFAHKRSYTLILKPFPLELSDLSIDPPA